MLLVSGVGIVASCSVAEYSESDKSGAGDDGSGAQTGTGGTSGGGGTGGGLPPETEDDSYTTPAVSGRWIWTANPDSGRVALIDATTARVTTANAGLAPTYLAAFPGASDDDSGAVVINVGSQDVSVFRSEGGVITSAEKVPLGAAANRLSMSGTSRWAIAWSDAALVPRADPTEGMQDVTVIDLAASPPKTQRLSVGYRPNRVFISANEDRAFVVCEPSVSVIELDDDDTARVLRDVEVASNPTEAASSRDVTVTADGALFFVRREHSPSIDVVPLDGTAPVTVTLAGWVTDLDLSPDGRSAYAVVRGSPATAPLAVGGSSGAPGAAGAGEPGGMGGEPGVAGEGGVAGGGGDEGTDGGTAMDSTVAVLPLASVLTEPTSYESISIPGVVGSITIAPSGETAVLYTTELAAERVVVLDTTTHVARTVAVGGPPRAVVASPDGAHAVIVTGPAAGSTKPGGFTIVPVKEDLAPRIQGTDAPPTAVAIGDSHVLVTVAAMGVPSGVYFARLPSLRPELIRLASEPLAVALMPDVGVGFVAQQHPEGRITFIDLVSGEPRTITGFELGSKVVTGD